MSGARFARSGRARFFLCFLALVLMLGMVAIFHNTTRQLDQTREQQLQCEQQQLTINEQLSTVIKQKFAMQKQFDTERSELMKTQKNLEEKLQNNSDQLANDKLESHVQYEKLQQAHKILQSEHKELSENCAKSKQQHLEEVNALNHKVQDILSKTQKEQNVLNSEIAMLKEKYNSLLGDKEHMDAAENRSRLLQLEHIVNEYQSHCNYQPKAVSSLAHLQINKPIDIPQIGAANSSPQTAAGEEQQQKSFSQQVLVGDGRYNINIKTNKTLKELTASTIGGGTTTTTTPTTTLHFAELQNRTLILNSVENFQILPKMLKLNKIKPDTQTIDKVASPLGAPHKLTSSEVNLSTNLSSTSSLPPLPMPPQQQQSAQLKKLPLNVAPIPENFADLLRNEEQQQQEQPQHEEKETEAGAHNNNSNNNKQVVETQGAANVPDKAEKVDKTDDGNNNRYANIVNDFGGKQEKQVVNHEEENIANADNSDNKNHQNDIDDGEPLVEAGDIEVKNNKKVLDTENVNNEVAGDQGKEVDDGLRLEEGMEEDADEDDDYSNLARQNGEQAIRN